MRKEGILERPILKGGVLLGEGREIYSTSVKGGGVKGKEMRVAVE